VRLYGKVSGVKVSDILEWYLKSKGPIPVLDYLENACLQWQTKFRYGL